MIHYREWTLESRDKATTWKEIAICDSVCQKDLHHYRRITPEQTDATIRDEAWNKFYAKCSEACSSAAHAEVEVP